MEAHQKNKSDQWKEIREVSRFANQTAVDVAQAMETFQKNKIDQWKEIQRYSDHCKRRRQNQPPSWRQQNTMTEWTLKLM